MPGRWSRRSSAQEAIDSLHGVRLNAIPSGTPESLVAPMVATVRTVKITLDPDAIPQWVREDAGERYSSRVELYDHPEGWVLNIDCEGRGRFLIRDAAIDVDWYSGTGPSHYFQTLGLALWLELKGILCLHANTLFRNDQAIGFIAPSQTGKTTLTAAFVAAGWTMLTDDMAAVYPSSGAYLIYPSGPHVRLWPDAGRHFSPENYDSCRRVHARFDKRVVPLRCADIDSGRGQALRRLFLLERLDDPSAEITFETLGPAKALLELMRNSMLAGASRQLGIEDSRLRSMAELLSTIPLTKMSYPSGLESLDRVIKAVENRAITTTT